MNFIYTFIILLSFTFSWKWPWNKDDHNSRSFTFNYDVVLESSDGEKLELWLPIPQSNEVQTISNLMIHTESIPYNIMDETKHKNKYVYIYAFEGTHKTKKISMSFDVQRKEHNNIEYKNIDIANYLQASTMVPTGEIFESIIKDNKLYNNENKTAEMRNIYEYVLSGMHYGKPKSIDDKYYKVPWLTQSGKYGMKQVSRDDVVNLYNEAKEKQGSYTFGKGNSMYACDIGVGNCTDYHSYFMSLSRTMDTPARFHMGFSISNESKGEVDGYHCWADYYVDGEGWYPVDISEADKAPEKSDYFFGTVCNNRVEMMVGRDFEFEGYGSGPVNLFIYPMLEINDIKSNAFKKFFSFEDL